MIVHPLEVAGFWIGHGLSTELVCVDCLTQEECDTMESHQLLLYHKAERLGWCFCDRCGCGLKGADESGDCPV
jgi:hypothetical protein